MLHRVKKEHDENEGKWIGVGGKFEQGESPEECMQREMLEETGLTAVSWRYRGIVTFVSDEWGTEYMHLFTVSDFTGTMRPDCDEGELRWIDKEKIGALPLRATKYFSGCSPRRSRFSRSSFAIGAICSSQPSSTGAPYDRRKHSSSPAQPWNIRAPSTSCQYTRTLSSGMISL